MPQEYASIEILRWGFAHLPGAVLYYAKELDIDMEDIGILAAIIYAFEKTKPLFQSGVRTGQVLQACSNLTAQKLSRKLTRLSKMELLEVVDGDTKSFTDKTVYLEPLMEKLQQLILRDHPRIISSQSDKQAEKIQIQEYEDRIQQLEILLEEEKHKNLPLHNNVNTAMHNSMHYKRVADFIAKKSGNLLSVKMENELQKWLDDFGFTPEFLLCMLELTFERNINNPRDITRIARDLKEYSVNTVEGLELYFKNYVDTNQNAPLRVNQFDPDIAEFGNFTGIDMNAEARKKVYYKWRYDWRFSHQMIMKAGEIMCQRTKNGGLEYIDSVLNNWMSKEIRSVADVDKEIAEFKARTKAAKPAGLANSEKTAGKRAGKEYELYVPPEVLEELKSKA
ncbi:Replication protein, DnaD/DnaB domain [Syntrophomonas zehnderi OL-4]|uniref:Replication protein, DnaD/DnaB domain n=1 Tax=Syntrophomonas zehnderi OL-4 TaxID=690567 RepID=A0A0E4GC31_9FIRM|nr:DnaD domain protein [Syntrophomonas zehnderi]CFX69535.1 Replication protein, DnaD/DnaB domain [Syntrophomonas zehnderi OL-4]